MLDFLQTNLSLVELVVLVLMTFAFTMASWMANTIRRTEAYRRYGLFIDQLDDVLWAAIMSVNGDAIDMDFWDDQQEQRMQNDETYIDSRMLYVIDVAEKWAAAQGVALDFTELFARAEGAYQHIKVFINPQD